MQRVRFRPTTSRDKPAPRLDRHHRDGRRRIGMQFLDRRLDRTRQRGARLDDHHRLLGALDLALPPVDRNHVGQNVHAGREPPLDQRRRPAPPRQSRAKSYRRTPRVPCPCPRPGMTGAAWETCRCRKRRKPIYERIAFVASPAPEARKALARLTQALRQRHAGKGRRRGGARRRRTDAAHAAPADEHRQRRSTACTAAPSAS